MSHTLLDDILSSVGSMIDNTFALAVSVIPYTILAFIVIPHILMLKEYLSRANFNLGYGTSYKDSLWTHIEEDDEYMPVEMPPETAVALDAIRRCVEEIVLASNQIRAHRKGRRWRETEC